ncbi:hypothetical protein L0244_14830 [bacterium]|nr:hypothetical protein [bacterium]MCI0614259.1 hypothetical protein [bacterium]
MRILTILFVLAITFSAHAEKKLFMSYLINGPVVSLNVAILSENLVVEKVVSETLPTPGGLTSIEVGNTPGEFSVYYNNRPSPNGPIKISKVTFEIDASEILVKERKTLNQRSNSLLNFDVNDSIGSIQLTNNSVNRFTLNQNQVQEFKNLKRDPLPGSPYGSSQVRLVTPSGANEFHGSLFQAGERAGVFFRNVINGTRQQPKLFQFVGADQPRNMTLIRGCGRSFFFGAYERTSPQGNRQIGHKIQELDNNDFHSVGQNIQIDKFRDHRNPDLSYFKTSDATLDVQPDGTTCRSYFIIDRFNNAKNANEFFGTVYSHTDSIGLQRRRPYKPIGLAIPNNSAAYGVDTEVIDF